MQTNHQFPRHSSNHLSSHLTKKFNVYITPASVLTYYIFLLLFILSCLGCVLLLVRVAFYINHLNITLISLNAAQHKLALKNKTTNNKKLQQNIISTRSMHIYNYSDAYSQHWKSVITSRSWT